MWRSLLTDLESVLKGAKPADLIRVPKSGPASRGEDAAAFSEWLPYRAWIADRQVFVNLDALGFCLEVRPQSGADEEMARVLTALYAASPPGTGIQFHLYASPAIRAPLARYAEPAPARRRVPEFDTSDAPAGTPTSTAPWPGVASGTTCRAAGHRCCPRRVTCSGLPAGGQHLASRQPGESLAPGGVAAAARRDPGHAARRRLPVAFVDGGGLINWVSALLDPHRQTGDASRSPTTTGASCAIR
jgi:conjugal transfer ATP-binding protein TraC